MSTFRTLEAPLSDSNTVTVHTQETTFLEPSQWPTVVH